MALPLVNACGVEDHNRQPRRSTTWPRQSLTIQPSGETRTLRPGDVRNHDLPPELERSVEDEQVGLIARTIDSHDERTTARVELPIDRKPFNELVLRCQRRRTRL